MIELDFSRTINRPCEATFAILTDLEQYLARWAKGPIAAERVEGDGGAGTRYTVTARVGPFKVKAPYHVITCEPPRRFGGSGVAGPVHFEEEYALTGEGGSTHLRYTASARPRGPFRVAEALISRQLSKLIGGDLDQLKELVETTL